MPRLNFYRLQVLNVVAELESISRAAEVLRLTQPAVTQQVRAAERFFGCRLLERASRGIRLTDNGRAVHAYVTQVLRGLEVLTAHINAINAGQSGRITLGTSNTLGNYLVPRLLGDFVATHPQADFILHVAHRSQVLEEVAGGVADLGLVLSDQTRPELVREPLAQVEMVLVAAPNHPLARQGLRSGADLRRERFVMPLSGSSHREVVEMKLRQTGVDRPLAAGEFSTGEAMKRAVEAGLGIGLFSRLTVTRELQIGTLVQIHAGGLRFSHPFDLVYRPDKAFGPLLEAFVQFLRNHTARMTV